MNWWFQDLTTRRGKFVIAEVPNAPLITFMVSLMLGVAIYPGFVQKVFLFISFAALFYWGVLEYRTGRSRFRKLLGILGILSVVAALFLFL
jgi:hypothetical protein